MRGGLVQAAALFVHRPCARSRERGRLTYGTVAISTRLAVPAVRQTRCVCFW